MQGRSIDQLNEGLQTFKHQLMSDSMATQRVEVGIVTFGPARILMEFVGADTFEPPRLVASGDTPMGAAIEEGLHFLESRKQVYKDNGISYYRPWIFLITDGSPTDDWRQAAQLVRAGDNNDRKQFNFFAVGVDDADMNTLGQICNPDRPPYKLKGLNFRELFSWLSSSLGGVSRSQPGDTVPLPVPTGWASV
jgi:uncharacterized protein YegL